MVVKAKLENQCAIRHEPNDMKLAGGKWQYWTFDTFQKGLFATKLTQKYRSPDSHNPSSVK